jgi:dihydroorotate dehydrogenase (fumarate)
MTDMSVEVAGLKLKNPLIIGSCSYTESVESIKKLEEAGAGAVVLKSLFQEQIMNDTYDTMGEISSTFAHSELNDYVRYFEEKNAVGNYLDLIVQAKAAVKIPVIASINCASFDKWVEFSSEIEKAGADALEINLYYLPSDPAVSDNTYVSIALKIAAELKKKLKIPFSFKLGYYSDTLAKDLLTISRTEAKALVLFNKPFNPDIDIDNEKIIAGYPYSSPSEISTSLRWIAIMSDFAETDLIATTGVHNGHDMVKQILAGAKAVQMASSLYLNSFSIISDSLIQLEDWMKRHNYKTLSDFRGKLSRKDNVIYDRVQFLKAHKR